VKCLQISPAVVRRQLRHLPAEVMADGWLCHREPCRRNRLSSSCLPWERRPTSPHPRRGCIALPAAALLSAPCRGAARPSTRSLLEKSKATRRPSIPPGCCLRGSCPELPFGSRRSSRETNGDSASPESPGAALTPSLNVRLDGSAWTGEVCTLSSCSVLGVAFSSSSPEEAELVQSVVWLRLHRGAVTLPWTCLPQRHRAGLF